ncbi:MAG TPA: endopeptidase La [Syntrophaceae bacterium]|nr:endopeptidase La [Syntrophaceae bacterium]
MSHKDVQIKKKDLEEGLDEMPGGIPEKIPILPVGDLVLFPKMIIPLVITEEPLIKLIDDALVGDKTVGVITSKGAADSKKSVEDLYTVGTAAAILKMSKMHTDAVRLIIQGIARFMVKNYIATEPYVRAQIQVLTDVLEKDIEVDALASNIKNLFHRVLELSPYLPSELGAMVMSIEEPGILADTVTSSLNLSKDEKQAVLETVDIRKRLEKVNLFLTRQIEVLELGSKIQSQVREGLDKAQREFILREQLKAIQKELGEKDERALEIEELRTKIKERELPPSAAKEAERELDRLSKMHPAAAEYTVSRTYLDWLLDLPWNVATQDNLDIEAAQKVLDEDHYNLDKVKTRILEYLAVRKLKSDMKGPILCFVGPPGTGKTSLGKSIARALGRKFYRMSLGGIRDEAEIRGHRRTYVGALPGRIIQGMRKAGSNNPVFMLDEVDKIGVDFRGDPASALLEVLDPEQNFAFSDHYLGVEFDLSKVMFITTANILDTIPPALRDRMEVLDLPGYTWEEKLRIAKEFLIPRQLKEHGLTNANLIFQDDAIKKIIGEYTREAGLRNLEREIATVCRRVAKEVAKGMTEPVLVTPEMIHKFLGPAKFFSELAERTSEPGVATGLAWTQAGGDIIFVEATKMPGKKTLTLTGQLGDVMKESAEAALSYVRSKSKELGIPDDFYEKNDIHIHVPAGAIPKDGPSAGITMFTALVSLLTDRPVRHDVAMTGEITLRGMALPVGGIKEKVLCAHRAGIKTIILPKRNEKDLEEIPKDIREKMDFHFVERMDEVIDIALTEKKE